MQVVVLSWGVITVCEDGTFKPKISGVVHQGGGGGNGSLDLKLGSRSFFHVTSSGHMDEVGFYKLARLFVGQVGKEDGTGRNSMYSEDYHGNRYQHDRELRWRQILDKKENPEKYKRRMWENTKKCYKEHS